MATHTHLVYLKIKAFITVDDECGSLDEVISDLDYDISSNDLWYTVGETKLADYEEILKEEVTDDDVPVMTWTRSDVESSFENAFGQLPTKEELDEACEWIKKDFDNTNSFEQADSILLRRMSINPPDKSNDTNTD